MNNIVWLTRLFLKNGTGAGNGNRKISLKARMMAIVFLLTIVAVPVIYAISSGMHVVYPILHEKGKEGVILSSALVIVSFMLLIFGILTVLTYFYLAGDLETLLPLPVEPYEIVAAKLLTVILPQYIIEAVFVAPLLWGYGTASHAGVSYYVSSFFIYLLLPIVPIAVSILLCTIVMRFINVGKNKERIRLFVGVMGIASAYLIRSGMDYLPNNTSTELYFTQASFIDRFANVIYTVRLAENSLLFHDATGYLNLAAFVITTLVALFLAFLVSQAWYFKGAMGLQDATAKRKVLHAKELSKYTTSSSVFFTYVAKEMRILFRTSGFLLHGLGRTLIFPILIVGYLLFHYGTIMGTDGFILGEVARRHESGTVIMMFLFTVFIGSTTTLSTTPISREGKQAFVMNYIPVSYTTQLMAKITPTVLVNSVQIVLVVVVGFLFRVPVVLIGYVVILAFLGGVANACVGLALDIRRPYLNWDSEYSVIRQNGNTILQFICNTGCGLVTLFLLLFGLPVLGLFLTIVFLYVTGIIFLFLYITKNAQERFQKMM